MEFQTCCSKLDCLFVDTAGVHFQGLSVLAKSLTNLSSPDCQRGFKMVFAFYFYFFKNVWDLSGAFASSFREGEQLGSLFVSGRDTRSAEATCSDGERWRVRAQEDFFVVCYVCLRDFLGPTKRSLLQVDLWFVFFFHCWGFWDWQIQVDGFPFQTVANSMVCWKEKLWGSGCRGSAKRQGCTARKSHITKATVTLGYGPTMGYPQPISSW